MQRLQIVPETGTFQGWKKLREGKVALLEIPESAARLGGLVGRKCRAQKAKVIKIFAKDGSLCEEGLSCHDEKFVYRVGQEVAPSNWCSDPKAECAPGIHFFLTKLEAEEYN